MKADPLDGTVYDKVFHNPNILENILNNVEGGLIRNLSIRLVSRHFNTSIIRTINQDHRTIKIEYIGHRLREPLPHINPHINDRRVDIPAIVPANPNAIRIVQPVQNVAPNPDPNVPGPLVPPVAAPEVRPLPAQDNNPAGAPLRVNFRDIAQLPLPPLVRGDQRLAEIYRAARLERGPLFNVPIIPEVQQDDPQLIFNQMLRNQQHLDNIMNMGNPNREQQRRELNARLLVFGELRQQDVEPQLPDSEIMIYINHRKILVNKVDAYLKFLNKIGAEVQKFWLKNIEKLRKQCRNDVHDSVMNFLSSSEHKHIQSVIGLTKICGECIECKPLQFKCRQFGPIMSHFMFYSIDLKWHFDRLEMHEQSLDTTMFPMSGGFRNRTGEKYKESCTAYFPPNITCDTLVIWTTEFDPMVPLRIRRRPQEEQAVITRRVLEFIVKQFKVKAIEFKLWKRTQQDIRSGAQNRSGNPYLTGFQLNDPFGNVKESEEKIGLTHVTLDLTNSVVCAQGLTENTPVGERNKSYQNCIANVQKVFNTNHIRINFSHWSHPTTEKLPDVIGNLLKTMATGDQNNLRLDVRYFGKKDQLDGGKLENVPSGCHYKSYQYKFSAQVEDVECFKHVMDNGILTKEKYIGKRFKIEDIKNGCTMNLEVMMKEKDFDSN